MSTPTSTNHSPGQCWWSARWRWRRWRQHGASHRDTGGGQVGPFAPEGVLQGCYGWICKTTIDSSLSLIKVDLTGLISHFSIPSLTSTELNPEVPIPDPVKPSSKDGKTTGDDDDDGDGTREKLDEAVKKKIEAHLGWKGGSGAQSPERGSHLWWFHWKIMSWPDKVGMMYSATLSTSSGSQHAGLWRRHRIGIHAWCRTCRHRLAREW